MGFTAKQNANGTWNVLNVPVFATLPAGARKNADEIGRAWMLRAVERAKQRAAEGYTGPCHIHHTGDAEPKRFAGKFLPREVGKLTYEGREVDAIFADLLDVPAFVYERIRAGELPFRSVEVFDWDKPELNALALMDTDVPFFRLGNLDITREIPHEGNADAERVRITGTPMPATAFAAVGAGGAALFRFADEKKHDPDHDDDTHEMCIGAKRMGAHCSGCAAYSDDDKEDRQMPPVDTDDTKKPAEMKALTDKVEAFTAQLADLTTRLTAAMTENTALVARCAALEAADQTRTRELFVTGQVKRVSDALAGRNVSPRILSHAEKLARSDADPAKATALVDEFIAMCKESIPKDPPSTFAGAVGRAAAEGDAEETTKLVQSLEGQGIAHLKAVEIARGLASQHADHVARTGSDIPLGAFLAAGAPKALHDAGLVGSAR